MKKFQARQGDVFLELVKELPKNGLKRKDRDGEGRVVLAYGEVTGHAHAIHDEEVECFEDESGTLWLSVGKEAILQHEEHGKIGLAPGKYKVNRQREYAPSEERMVAD